MTDSTDRAPLTDASVDVEGIPGFILDTVKLLSSELAALSTGDEFKAAALLWCRAWQQKPAASLPDDDRVLASFAGMAGNLAKWRKVKPMAMRGFILCSDGRWYHPVLAFDAVRASKARQQRRDAIARRYDKPTDEPPPEPTKKPTAVDTSVPPVPVQYQSSTNPDPKPGSLNSRFLAGSGGSASPRPGKLGGSIGIDWGAIVTRMQSHGFTAEEAWTLVTEVGDRTDIGRRMQGAMRKAEERGRPAYAALLAIAGEVKAA